MDMEGWMPEGSLALPDSYDVVLMPSYAQVRAFNAACAEAHEGGLFGHMVTTFPAWVEELWSLHGDGRRMATSMQSSLIMAGVLGDGGLAGLPNLPSRAVRFVRRCAGLREFDAALDGSCAAVAGLSEGERAFLDACARYRCELDRSGLIERGDAVRYLAAHAEEVFLHPVRVALVSATALPPLQQRFLDACAATGRLAYAVVAGWSRGAGPVGTGDRVGTGTGAGRGSGTGAGRGSGPCPIGRDIASPAVTRADGRLSVRFAFPAGGYAQPALLLDIVDEVIADGRAIVSARDPLGLYHRVAPALAERGLRCAGMGSKRFSMTAFGRAYLAMLDCLSVDQRPWDSSTLFDALSFPPLRHAWMRLWRGSAAVRGDRLSERDATIRRLGGDEGLLAVFLELVDTGSASSYEVIRRVLRSDSASGDGWVAEQLAALDALQELDEAQRETAQGVLRLSSAHRSLIDQLDVRIRHATFERGAGVGPDVLITDMRDASTREPASHVTLVVLDLDSDSYPVTEKDDAFALLARRTGIPWGEPRLMRMRRIWADLLRVPSHHLVLGRCLNDGSAAPRYPCALLEEFIDCYRVDPTATDDLDRVYGLPEVLRCGINVPEGATALFVRGEEDLVSDVRAGMAPPVLQDTLPALDPAEVLDRLVADIAPEGVPVLSPSQIEQYLECPQRWFLLRRLHADPLDEGFGPREAGSYRHAIMQRFYQLLIEQGGQARVTQGNLDLAHALLDEAIVEIAAQQACDGGRDRYVPIPGTTEEMERARIDEELHLWLGFESGFLSGALAEGAFGDPARFEPRAFEFPLGEHGITYAGCHLRGTIDRVDVCRATGRIMVLDYKGRLGPRFDVTKDCLTEGMDLSHKVQALIYASAIERSPGIREAVGASAGDEGDGLRVAGALYVSYHRGNEVRGVYSGEALGGATIAQKAGRSKKGCSDAELRFLLDDLEARIRREVIVPMMQGVIEPSPRNGRESCQYCPAIACPRREG